MLGRGAGDADRVAFLEGVGADQMAGHLAGDDDERDRIHQRVDHAGYGIGGAGAGGDEHHADLAGRAGIAFGRMRRTLLVPNQDVLQLVLLEQRIIDREHRAARIAENGVDTLVEQRPNDDFGAGHLFAHRDLRLTFIGPVPSMLGNRAIKKGPRRAPACATVRDGL